jgi:hypothetical protein
MTDPGPEDLSFTSNWDRLRDLPQDGSAPSAGGREPDSEQAPPPLIILLAAAWGDLVAVLLVCTAGLLALVGFGHRVTLPCLPWAVALAVTWWVAASAVLVVVRRGTPGMLMAGVVFSEAVAPRRVGLVVVVSLVVGLTLGLPALLGARLSPLGAAAGSPLRLLG